MKDKANELIEAPVFDVQKAEQIYQELARQQGIKIGEIENWVFVIGHLHHEEMIDLGGDTELIVLPSMSEEDDWHSDSGYVGAKKNSMLISYDYELGKKGVISFVISVYVII